MAKHHLDRVLADIRANYGKYGVSGFFVKPSLVEVEQHGTPCRVFEPGDDITIEINLRKSPNG
ncbi:hypothetical protein LCGC14_1115060 [marine sediment metagenome]|uniref:Uncharacterized protein n=1 Tax=marine sediment metagenome TaxID=412755 RepID=A0A0F9PNN0_9ZZZZ